MLPAIFGLLVSGVAPGSGWAYESAYHRISVPGRDHEAPPAVAGLFPSVGHNAKMLRPLAEMLARIHRRELRRGQQLPSLHLLLVDYPGFGKANAQPHFDESTCIYPQARALAEALRPSIKQLSEDARVYPMGHSLGGLTALFMAAELKGVESAVLLSPPYLDERDFTHSDGRPEDSRGGPALSPTAKQLLSYFSGHEASFDRIGLDSDTILDWRTATRVLRVFGRRVPWWKLALSAPFVLPSMVGNNWGAMKAQTRHFSKGENLEADVAAVADVAQRIQAPIHIVVGDRDALVSSEMVQRLTERLTKAGVPAGSLLHVPRASHTSLLAPWNLQLIAEHTYQSWFGDQADRQADLADQPATP